MEKLLEEDRKTKGELTRTVRAFGESSLNVKRTAKRLKLHTNTVYFRLNRVQEITDVDPRSFEGLTVILTALRLLAREPPPGVRLRTSGTSLDRPPRSSVRSASRRSVKMLPPTDA